MDRLDGEDSPGRGRRFRHRPKVATISSATLGVY